MSVPAIAVTSSRALDTPAEALLLGLPPLDETTELADWPGLAATLRAIDWKGTPGAFARVALPGVTALPLAVAGLGAAPDANAVRAAIGAGVRSFTGIGHLAVAVVGVPDEAALAQAVAEGAALGAYAFASYKTADQTTRASEITVHTAGNVDVSAVAAIATAVALVKDLTTTPAQWLGPDDLVEAAVAAVADLPVTTDVWDEQRLAADGFGGILGVGQGSVRPPRLVRLDYAPATSAAHVALVGKGITFDSGGLSLKPAASMVGMKDDMAGAATVLAVVTAAAQLGLPVHVTGWLAIADNMPSGSATRPGDVLRMRDGQTVEVLNTDAEGRLVLGDAIAVASLEHPDLIIDVATLTGAILVALGTRHTGVFGESQAAADFIAAAASAGEDAWLMPLPDHMESDLDSPIADMRNANMGSRFGGASYAGLFLRRFVGRRGPEADADRIPWVHLDVAGSAVNEGSPFGYTDKGATGATVRSLLVLLQSLTTDRTDV